MNMVRFKINLMRALLCLLLGSNSALWADDGSRLLAKYDLNGDDLITQDEVMSKKLNVFRHLDRNNDGQVDFSEYESMDAARREYLLKARFAKIDQNADDEVSEDEYSQFLGKFSSIDANSDGVLSLSEVRVADGGADNNGSYCLWWFCFRTDFN